MTTCKISATKLCVIPQRQTAWATAIMDKPQTYFEGCKGSTLFAPLRDIPHSLVSDYVQVQGTRIDGYTSDLDVLLWQFGRNWMGHPREQYALIAAPQQEVFSVFNGTIYLVQAPELIEQKLPDDCNVHWRGFPQKESGAFAQLLSFLRQTEVSVLESVAEVPAISFLRAHEIPLTKEQRTTWGSGDSLLKVEQDLHGNRIIRLATIFTVLYGFDDND